MEICHGNNLLYEFAARDVGVSSYLPGVIAPSRSLLVKAQGGGVALSVESGE